MDVVTCLWVMPTDMQVVNEHFLIVIPCEVTVSVCPMSSVPIFFLKIICLQFLFAFCILFSHPDCKLVVSHDDYSLTSKLPRERTSVVTVLRNPVDRVFSTYEFLVEVVARFLVHPNLTSVKLMSTRVLTNCCVVRTLDIRPWKYLVPCMREDLFARVCLLLQFSLWFQFALYRIILAENNSSLFHSNFPVHIVLSN